MRLSPSLKRCLAWMAKGVKSFRSNVRAKVSIDTVVGIAVGLFLMAILGDIALEQIYSANTTGWDASVKTVFQVVLPILALLGTAIAYVKSK